MGKKEEGAPSPLPPTPTLPGAVGSSSAARCGTGPDGTGRGPPAVAFLGSDHQSSETKLVGDVDLHIAWEKQREDVNGDGLAPRTSAADDVSRGGTQVAEMVRFMENVQVFPGHSISVVFDRPAECFQRFEFTGTGENGCGFYVQFACSSEPPREPARGSEWRSQAP